MQGFENVEYFLQNSVIPSLLETVHDIEIQFSSRFKSAILQVPDKMEAGKSCYYILYEYI